MVEDLIRFGVSIPSDLLTRFDEVITSQGYSNRSEAIRDLIRKSIVEKEWETNDKIMVGIIIIVYNHHTRGLQEKLTDLHHHSNTSVISTLHVHMDEHNCLEISVVKGLPVEIKAFADNIRTIKGTKYIHLAGATTGEELE
jgi:CopG family transcriptional regulator, nickel-responsive regulator